MELTCLCVVYASNVVHAAGDEEDAVWRPGKVVDLGAYGSAHGLDSPCLLVLETLLEIGVRGVAVSRNPEQDVAVVSRRGQHFACTWLAVVYLTSLQLRRTSRAPSHHVHSLRVLDKGREVGDLPLFAVVLDVP
jgi:hypothetical protein